MSKDDRRWRIRLAIIMSNIIFVVIALLADMSMVLIPGLENLKLNNFNDTISMYQTASAVWFTADYMTKPSEK